MNTTSSKTRGLEGLARAGYLAKGTVYLIVGLLAATAAFGSADPQGSSGALQTLLEQPYGKFALGAVGFGLFGYACWKMVQAVKDTERKGTDLSGLVQRTGYFLSGLAHVGLAIFCARAVASGNQASGGNAEGATATAMSQPLGQWIVGCIGLGLIAFGLFRLSIAWSQSFKKKFHLEQMSQNERDVAVKAGSFGIAARAFVFGLTGLFLVQAAMSANPSKAGTMQQVLRAVEQQGTWYLAVLAFGLIAYAVYQGFLARYRHIEPRTA